MKCGENSALNIGYVANIHYGLLPATLGTFRKLHPGVAVNLFDMTISEQFQPLDGRKIDLGFVGLPPRSPATLCSPNAWRTIRCSSRCRCEAAAPEVPQKLKITRKETGKPDGQETFGI